VLHVSARWVSQNLSAHDWHQWWLHHKSSWVHAQVTKNCFVVVYHWAPLSKLEFIQWKEVDCPTFTQIWKSAINCLDYGNSSSGIQTDCLWQTICILERQLLVSITQSQHSSYSMTLSRNSDESCHLRVWLTWQCTSAQVIGCSASSLQLWVCSTKPSCLQSRLGSQ